MTKTGIATAAAFLITLLQSAAHAQTVVTFDGVVVESCVLSVTTPGTLGVSTDSGKVLGSEQPSGVAAVLAVTATAGAPTITFSAPTMSARPSAYTGTPTVSMRYTSLGGANQAYTSGQSQYTSTNPLTDAVTVHARAVDNGGFAAGTYQVQTTATCQQP